MDLKPPSPAEARRLRLARAPGGPGATVPRSVALHQLADLGPRNPALDGTAPGRRRRRIPAALLVPDWATLDSLDPDLPRTKPPR